MYSFTAMERARIKRIAGWKSTASGRMIFSTLLLRSSKPIRMISIATIRPEMYSIRPWPKGWSRSGSCAARWKPRRDTTEEPASLRLFSASAVMAMEPLRRPAKSFKAHSSTFSTIPASPQSIPQRRRTLGSSVLG